MRRLLDPRRQGGRARHAVYDLVLLVSVLVALQHGDSDVRRIAVYLCLTLVGIALAELYADVVGKTLEERRQLTRPEVRDIASNVLGGLVLAAIPLLWLLAYGLGAMSRDTALDAALWTGVFLLAVYAAFGARAAQLPPARALAWGLAVGLGGVALVTLKSILH